MKIPSLLLLAAIGYVYSQNTTTRASTTSTVTTPTTDPTQACANPLFKGFAMTISDKDSEVVIIDIEKVKPALFPSSNNTVCTAYAGQQSCCTAGHLERITKVAQYHQRVIAHARAALLDEMNAEQAAVQSDIMTNFTSNEFVLDCQLLGFSLDNCIDLNNMIRNFMDAQNKFKSDSLTCLSALEDYTTGMLCFACTTQWSNFVHSSNSSVNIHRHTCANIAQACGAVNDDYVAMYNIYASIIATIGKARSNLFSNPKWQSGGRGKPHPSPADWILGYPDLCGGNITNPGNCTYTVCYNWMQGLGANFPHINIPSIKGMHRALSEGASSEEDLVQSGHRFLVDSTYSNYYTDSGYDSVCVGSAGINCASKVDPGSSGGGVVLGPSGPVESNVWIGGVVVGSLVVVGVAGIAVMKFSKRDNKTAATSKV